MYVSKFQIEPKKMLVKLYGDNFFDLKQRNGQQKEQLEMELNSPELSMLRFLILL
jgi:hypothetical protein